MLSSYGQASSFPKWRTRLSDVVGGTTGGINKPRRTAQLFRFDGHFSSTPMFPLGRANDFNELSEQAEAAWSSGAKLGLISLPSSPGRPQTKRGDTAPLRFRDDLSVSTASCPYLEALFPTGALRDHKQNGARQKVSSPLQSDIRLTARHARLPLPK